MTDLMQSACGYGGSDSDSKLGGGGKEYKEMFQIPKGLLHRKVVLLEIAQMSETTSLERLESDRDAAHSVDDDVLMVANEYAETESEPKMQEALL